MLLIAQRIHGLPETVMYPRGQLTVLSQIFHGLLFPNGVLAVDEFQHARFQNEKPAVDEPSFGRRFLLEGHDSRILSHDSAETRRGPDAGDRGPAAVRGVKRNFRSD